MREEKSLLTKIVKNTQGIYTLILTINVLLILQVQAIFFFMRDKHIMGPFEGFFEELETFWPLKMVPSETRGHFEAKKVLYMAEQQKQAL